MAARRFTFRLERFDVVEFVLQGVLWIGVTVIAAANVFFF